MSKQKGRKNFKSLDTAAGFNMNAHDVELRASKVQTINGWDIVRPHGVVILIIVFFLASAPLLPSTARYRGDEALYTNAAIRMVQTGDYLTPYYYDGTPRFEKPIFVYWVLAASYKLFGINLFSSRIPFLIAGCLIIWLTYQLSLLLFRRTAEAFVAAAIIASNLTLFHVSVRSTTDTFLCLFISMSLYGFARLIFNRDQRMINYLFAYLGAGLAAATKGVWGLSPVAFAFFFCYVRTRDTIRLRELIEVKAIALAVFVALFWYVIAYYQHGDVFLHQFFSDQIGKRFSGSKWYIVENILTYVSAIGWEFMPWPLILILLTITHRTRGMLTQFFHDHKEACLFILGWYLSLCLIFSFGNILRTRFLLPAYPLVSTLYAALLVPLARRGKGLSASVLRLTERITLVVCFLFGLTLTVAGMFIDTWLMLGGMLTLCVGAVLYATLFRWRGVESLVMVSLCLILFISITENFINRAIYDSPAPRVVDTVREYTHGSIEIAAVDLFRHYNAQVYVLSGGNIRVNMLQDNITLDTLRRFRFILVSEQFKEKVVLDGYAVEECGYSYKEQHFKFRSMLGIRSVGDLRALIDDFKTPYYLLIKSESPQQRDH